MSKPRRWICHNRTQDTVIATQVRKADHYFARLIGLLPKKALEEGEGLWIIPCSEIHSIGMRFVFDAIFLDKDLHVVHLMPEMKPMRISKMIKGAKTVLEIDGGMIARSQTQLGDQLSFDAVLSSVLPE